MATVPLITKLVVVAFMAAGIWWAFFGPPPDERDMGTAKLWGATACVLYVAGGYALLSDRGGASLLVGLGVMALCLAFWHARGDDGEGGDDGDDGDGPLDWDEFDRARSAWDRPLAPL